MAVASASLDKVVNQVMLRRQNDVIAKYLPAKLDVVVFCTLTEEQQSMYRHASTEGRKAVQVAEAGGKKVFSSALRAVSTLKRIVNDPEMAQLAQRLEGMGHEPSDVVAKLAEARAKAPPDPVHSVALSGKLSAMVELLMEVQTRRRKRPIPRRTFGRKHAHPHPLRARRARPVQPARQRADAAGVRR